MPKRQAGQVLVYIRVSSDDQNEARQLDITEGADRVYTEKTSSAKARPELDKLLEYAREGDTIKVWSIDRLARSLRDLKNLVYELTENGVTVEFVSEHLVFTPKGNDNPYAELMLDLLGAIYSFERKMLLQRQKEGIAKAKQAGKYRGRKEIVLTPEQQSVLGEKLAAKVPKTIIAKDLGISRSRLYQELSNA